MIIVLYGLYLGDGSASSPVLKFTSDTNTGIYRYGNDQIGFAAGGACRLVVQSGSVVPFGHLLPSEGAKYNLGNATFYWNDVSYKTLSDRGCLGVFDEGVEMPDGRVVSDLEALCAIQPHPELKTVYGVPRFDYSTMPKAVYKPAPIAEKDIYEERFGPNGEMIRELKWRKGEKMGEDGAELTALVSIIIGALRTELPELKQRLEALEESLLGRQR